ncbi:MAG: DUF3857 domain-containing protein [Bacteroidetes bacterium]|nr:DUF3857 domain-containing protein [Bacteroidota bacterium]
MKRFLLLLTFVSLSIFAIAQKGDFDFGKVTYKELEMSKYDPDTSAVAVVLNEFGQARINDDQNVIFDYHVKIKILKTQGQREGDFYIPLYKNNGYEEKLLSVKGSTFNLENRAWKENKLDEKKVFTEKTNKYLNEVKFALPEVRVGSVIEVMYSTESPFRFQFHPWEFQSDIPKVNSLYWCKIPANWIYNITLRGYYKLSTNETSVLNECFQPEGIPEKGDCMLGKYGMQNVPAFKEEKYMTAKKNFVAGIYFELSEVRHFDGTKTKYGEEWKDVDRKLREHEDFGGQIKRNKNLWEDKIKPLVDKEADPVAKATIIYDQVRHWYSFDGDNRVYTETDAKKVYESRKGNSAEINLALVGALLAAEFEASPVLISTRDHGLPIKIHPQQTSFNYVAARVKIGEKEYLLDATDDFLPFGVLPMRCLNDQGRIISKEESGWVNLTPTQRQKTVITMNVKLDEAGELKGTMSLQYSGYDAIDQRKKINGKTKEEYVKELTKELNDAVIENYSVENETDLTKPLVEKMDITLAGGEGSGSSIVYFNPFVMNRYEKNPFQSNERLYPVDLGAPIETGFYINVELPEGMMVDEAPKSIAFSLPNSGGKCLVNVSNTGGKVSLACVIALNKAIYTSEEYHYLKEFFARIVQIQQSSFVFKKK